MTVQTALLQGTQLLQEGAISAPRLTAEVLLAHALHRERVYLYAHPEEELTEVAWIHYGRYLHERLNGKPTQYITGRQEFYGRDFRVTAGCPDSAAGNRASHPGQPGPHPSGRCRVRCRRGLWRNRHHTCARDQGPRSCRRYFYNRPVRCRRQCPPPFGSGQLLRLRFSRRHRRP